MITWIAVKAAWASFLGWCKERWELLVGVLVGVLGMLALKSSSRDMKKTLEEKNKLNDQLRDAEAAARARAETYDLFLHTNGLFRVGGVSPDTVRPFGGVSATLHITRCVYVAARGPDVVSGRQRGRAILI